MTSPEEELPTVLSTSKVSLPEHVVYRRFAAETVLLNLESGQYHGLNPTGGRMLEVLEAEGTVERAAAQLAEEYQVPPEEIDRDLRKFCADLAQRGLVEIDAPERD